MELDPYPGQDVKGNRVHHFVAYPDGCIHFGDDNPDPEVGCTHCEDNYIYYEHYVEEKHRVVYKTWRLKTCADLQHSQENILKYLAPFRHESTDFDGMDDSAGHKHWYETDAAHIFDQNDRFHLPLPVNY